MVFAYTRGKPSRGRIHVSMRGFPSLYLGANTLAELLRRPGVFSSPIPRATPSKRLNVNAITGFRPIPAGQTPWVVRLPSEISFRPLNLRGNAEEKLLPRRLARFRPLYLRGKRKIYSCAFVGLSGFRPLYLRGKLHPHSPRIPAYLVFVPYTCGANQRFKQFSPGCLVVFVPYTCGANVNIEKVWHGWHEFSSLYLRGKQMLTEVSASELFVPYTCGPNLCEPI